MQIGQQSNGSANGSIWLGNVSASGSASLFGTIAGNTTLQTNSTLSLNAGSNINLDVGGNIILAINTTTLSLASNIATPKIYQVAPSSDLATTSLTLQAQSAYTSATSNITGGNLVLSSGVGVVNGSEAASEAAGKLILQSGGNQQYGFDGYGMFCEQASVSVATTGTVNLTAAEVLCPYIVVSGTMTGNVTLQFPGTVASNTTRMWHLDLNGVVFATHTLTFSIGTGSTPATLTALTTNSNVVTLFAPSANVCYLNL